MAGGGIACSFTNRVAHPMTAPNPEETTILLVDDEQSVRSIVMKILQRAKYKVIEAESGEAAIRISDSHPDKIDLLISDMYMPGLRGPEVAQALAPKRPGLRVLFMSGYAEQDSRAGVPFGANFLKKPFSGKELAAKVVEALKGPPAG
jgi:two-component system cell cycle sensor histidine kinase/response regulator CckA